MKGWFWILIVVTAAAGWWWWWRRRQGLSVLPFLPDAGVGSPMQPYYQSAAATPVGALPPVAPTGRSVKDTVVSVGGQINQAAFQAGCTAYTGQAKLCQTVAPVAGKIGEYQTKALIAVGSGTKKVLKAIIPGW